MKDRNVFAHFDEDHHRLIKVKDIKELPCCVCKGFGCL